jgi:hypothetical protein
MAKWGEIKCPRCAELEAKLEKAVEMLRFLDAILAELKGQDDERTNRHR